MDAIRAGRNIPEGERTQRTRAFGAIQLSTRTVAPTTGPLGSRTVPVMDCAGATEAVTSDARTRAPVIEMVRTQVVMAEA